MRLLMKIQLEASGSDTDFLTAGSTGKCTGKSSMSDQINSKVITQDDVAQRAGVSRSIVSYVINNGPRKVSSETRDRVLAAIKELGYRPNKHAQMLSTTDDNIAEKYIGIILAANFMFKRPYYGSILASMH